MIVKCWLIVQWWIVKCSHGTVHYNYSQWTVLYVTAFVVEQIQYQNHFILCIWRWYAVGFMARDTVHDIQVKMAAPHWWQIKLIFLWFWNYCTFEDQIYLCTFYEHHKTIANNIMDKILFKITQNISQVTFSRKPDDITCAELYFFGGGFPWQLCTKSKQRWI